VGAAGGNPVDITRLWQVVGKVWVGRAYGKKGRCMCRTRRQAARNGGRKRRKCIGWVATSAN